MKRALKALVILLAAIPVMGIVAFNSGIIAFQQPNQPFYASSQVNVPTPVPQQIQTPSAAFDSRLADNEQRTLVLYSTLDALRGEINALKTAQDSTIPAPTVSSPTNLPALNSLHQEVLLLKKQVAFVKANATASGASKSLEDKLNALASSIDMLRQQLEALSAQVQSIAQKSGQNVSTPPAPTQPPIPEIPKNKTATSPSILPTKLSLSLDGVVYHRGDTTVISGVTDPNGIVTIRILKDSSEIYKRDVQAGASGKYRQEYLVAMDMPAGTYKVSAMRGNLKQEAVFTVQVSVTSAKSATGILTISVERDTFAKGDYVSITGKAPAHTSVMVAIVPPNNQTTIRWVSSNTYGIYQTLFGVPLGAPSGDWTLIAQQGNEAARVVIRII